MEKWETDFKKEHQKQAQDLSARFLLSLSSWASRGKFIFFSVQQFFHLWNGNGNTLA
jgi:hypothetical protein